MAYKALKSFIGSVNMSKDEVIDKIDKDLAKKLIAGGYIEEVGGDKPKTRKPSKKSEEA